MSVSFAMWLIIKHYIILTNFCVSVRAKVSLNLSLIFANKKPLSNRSGVFAIQ